MNNAMAAPSPRDPQGGEAPTTLMLVLPLPLYSVRGARMIDAQARNGICRWLDNFDRIIYCLPLLEVESAPADAVPLDEAGFSGRVTIEALPNRRHLGGFMTALPATAARLDRLIDRATHLSFAIGGLFGDWAAVAALRAAKKKRKFSVWTDRVESAVTAFHASRSTGAKRLYWTGVAFAMKHYERLVISRAAVGLFHGADCYAAYAQFNPASHIVHNIHLSETARIDPEELARKQRRTGTRYRIVYAGRAHADKGVSDWIATLALLANATIDFTATWYGDGPELEMARSAVAAAGLDQRVDFAGALKDRDAMMRHIREADIFLFCHKTPESPRCLIEALISGTPIVGYGTDYSRDLIAEDGGGVLTEGDPATLAAALIALCGNRQELAALMGQAARSGHHMTDTGVFRHRSDLIKAATV
ncbi:glycosyltransferase [Sphingomonas sp. Tas61C01]|uniref:glycosyltransferase n=1 Tax=Sphingomonas sp. Tas61C01 TaxID=3458297 RepID=UPI00403E4186